MTTDAPLEQRIEALLADPAHAAHPLRAALEELFGSYVDQIRQIDRVARIADRYQWAERDRGLDYATRFRHQLRQIDKVVRISDHYQRMLWDMKERLQTLSDRDDLTGLPNRRYMQARLQEAVERGARRSGDGPFCVVLADVDHFKRVNDSWGHDVGDRLLQAIADCVSDNLREADVCARWGGEEFLMLFPATGAADAHGVLARLQQRIAALTETLPDGAETITLSFGLTVCDQPEEAVEAILKRVDRALYAAKRQGRNQIVTL